MQVKKKLENMLHFTLYYWTLNFRFFTSQIGGQEAGRRVKRPFTPPQVHYLPSGGVREPGFELANHMLWVLWPITFPVL